MNSEYAAYDCVDAFNRIEEILNSSDYNYEDKDSIPDRNQLTFTNGFYVNCSSMFVDMRGSSELSDKYKRPTLARIYRIFISELIAIMRSHTGVSELNIQGDCVWGVYNTPKTKDIDELFAVSAVVSSMIDILNWRFEQRKLEPLTIGVGMSWGRALMIKAGYKGSGVNDVVWMGDVVNDASKLCSYGNDSWSDRETMVSSVFYQNLNEDNKALLEWNSSRQCYHGFIVNRGMDKWLQQQKNK